MQIAAEIKRAAWKEVIAAIRWLLEAKINGDKSATPCTASVKYAMDVRLEIWMRQLENIPLSAFFLPPTLFVDVDWYLSFL